MAFKIILLPIILILSAFFSSSETALFSLSKIYIKKLENEKGFNKKFVIKLLKKPQKLLITILLGNTVANVSFASLSVMVAVKIAESAEFSTSMAMLIEIVIVTTILLVFGEILPKVFALNFAEKYIPFITFPLYICTIILYPPVKILELFVSLITPANAQTIGDLGNKITTDDIKNIVQESSDGVVDIKQNEREMIRSIFDFSETTVKEIMTPRIDIVGAEINVGVDKLKKIIQGSGFSRIPIYRGNIDNIIGIVYSKDIILKLDVDNEIKKLMRKCFFAPEKMKIKNLLNNFQKNKFHLAIVVDEYGGTYGIVTLEDILEEIVGEILDEFDEDPFTMSNIGKHEFLINCSIDIDDIDDKFGLQISEEFDSFSGFLYNIFGKIPQKGESVTYLKKYKFTVEDLDEQRIKTVRLYVKEKQQD
ncbi:MAG: hemolysin family protein [Candidatus Cloacimonadota bacterium]|nr:hemolysin family protein [Candidatus Cloacimonadota bacterium]